MNDFVYPVMFEEALSLESSFYCNLSSCRARLYFYSVAQWLARRTRDPAVAGLIPTTAHVVIGL